MQTDRHEVNFLTQASSLTGSIQDYCKEIADADEPKLNNKTNEELKAKFENRDDHYPGSFVDVIFSEIDLLDGIHTQAVSCDNFKTGIGFIRNAAFANLTPDNSKLNNFRRAELSLYQRAYTLMEAVLYVIEDHADFYKATLEKEFKKLFDYQYKNKGAIKKHEKAFNTLLLSVLVRSGEAKNCDYSALLDHYRSLAGLLYPARSVVTVTKNTLENGNVYHHIEQADPITKKTESQKNTIDAIKEGDNSFTRATYKFKSLLREDDRRLPSQARSQVSVSVKNGYKVSVKHMLYNGNDLIQTKSSEFLRHGSLVFTGNKLPSSEENLLSDTKENIKQLLTANDNKKLHLNLLVTDCSDKNQDRIIRFTKKAADQINKESGEPKVIISNTPANALARFYLKRPAPELKRGRVISQWFWKVVNWFDFSIRKRRHHYAAKLIDIAEDEDYTTGVSCASGQDRTGTVAETSAVNHISEFHGATSKSKKSADHVDQSAGFNEASALHAAGRHNPFIATVAAPGSYGLKSDSRVAGLFSKRSQQALYHKTAKTNKKPAVGSAWDVAEQVSVLDEEHRIETENKDPQLFSELNRNHMPDELDSEVKTAEQFANLLAEQSRDYDGPKL